MGDSSESVKLFATLFVSVAFFFPFVYQIPDYSSNNIHDADEGVPLAVGRILCSSYD